MHQKSASAPAVSRDGTERAPEERHTGNLQIIEELGEDETFPLFSELHAKSKRCSSVSYDYYKVFYQVARMGSLTMAAQVMSITQPALSKAVLQLEKALGCTLFSRRRKGMELTPEGQVLYRHIAQACEQILLGEKAIESMVNLGSGEIYIGSSEMILRSFLLPRLKPFRQTYPDIKIYTRILTAASVPSMLAEGSIDMALVTTPVGNHADLQSLPVGIVHDVFVAGESFSQLRGKTLTFQELLALPMVCPNRQTGTRVYVDSFFRNRGLVLTPEFELGTTSMVTPFVEQGLGIGIVAREFILSQLEQGTLFEISTKEAIPPREISLVSRRRARISKAGREFVRMFSAGNAQKTMEDKDDAKDGESSVPEDTLSATKAHP